MPRTKTYKTLINENLKALEKIADETRDFDLLKALSSKSDMPKCMKLLWGVYKGIAEGDNTKIATDKRASLGSRYNENFKRWKQLAQWAGTDVDSKYAEFYAKEREMLEWYLTESLVDIYR